MAGTITPDGGSAITCDFVKCNFPTLKSRVETFVRRGYDGYGISLDALGDSDFKITVTKFGTLAQVITWAESVEALQGEIGAVVNDRTTSVDDILFERVSAPVLTTAIRHVADDGTKGVIEIMAKRLS